MCDTRREQGVQTQGCANEEPLPLDVTKAANGRLYYHAGLTPTIEHRWHSEKTLRRGLRMELRSWDGEGLL
jgi:hypothetical protein